MNNEKLVHDLIVDTMRRKYARDYKEIVVDENACPELILKNHGLVLAVVSVETDSTISPEKADRWKEVVEEGNKLILMVPKNARVRVTDILWQKGIMDRVSVGSYEIAITMP
ncbi:MAG: hypothetical protein FD164_1345 [Nitrospirae bacterium]|nr:MAG: hypothetical protein FD164_1345 [Nitrospirota bacterium]